MAEYIDRAEVMEWVKNWHKMDRYYHPYAKGKNIPTAELADIIERIPSVDVQPVVRCKDCKHRDAEDGLCKGRGWPMQLVPDDGFCDKGERSEE